MSISVTFMPNGKELITDGMIINTISRIGVVLGSEGRGKIFQDWEAVAGKVRGEAYVTGGSMIDAFLSTVLAGYLHGNFAVVKQQFLPLYRKAKTELPAAFSQSSGIIHMEAQRQDLFGKEGGIRTTQDDEIEQFLKCFGYTVGSDFASRIRNTLPWSSVTLTREIILLCSEGSHPVVLRATGPGWGSLANAMSMALCTESSTKTWNQENLLSSEAGKFEV